MSVSLRSATVADLPTINDIYNHYVLNSTCTYQLDPETMEDRRKWFDDHGQQHPITVATLEDNVIGWGSLSRFHKRAAYSKTVENSLYIHPDHRRKGIGSLLLKDQLTRARQLGHHTILAIIDSDQVGSITLHERFGFSKNAHLKQLGFKFNRWLDVVYMQLIL
jgi:phosphinothricin acetyltransferase